MARKRCGAWLSSYKHTLRQSRDEWFNFNPNSGNRTE